MEKKICLSWEQRQKNSDGMSSIQYKYLASSHSFSITPSEQTKPTPTYKSQVFGQQSCLWLLSADFLKYLRQLFAPLFSVFAMVLDHDLKQLNACIGKCECWRRTTITSFKRGCSTCGRISQTIKQTLASTIFSASYETIKTLIFLCLLPNGVKKVSPCNRPIPPSTTK